MKISAIAKALKNRLSGTVTYKAPPEKNQSLLSEHALRKIRTRRTKPTNTIRQYGDKGYRSSDGRGVGP